MILGLIFTFNEEAKAQVSATEAVTQGQKKVLVRESRWTSTAQWFLQRSRDEEADFFTGILAGFGYSLSDNYTLYGQLGYFQPINDNPEKLERFGLTDTEIGINTAPFLKLKNGFQISSTAAITLPSSEISQRAGLRSGVLGGVVTAMPLWAGLRISTIHLGNLNFYEFETQDESGFVYNFPYSFTNLAALSWFYQRFYSTFSFGWTYLKDYSGEDVHIQSLRTGAGFLWTPRFRTEFFARWRDRTLSNNSAFADGTTFLGTVFTFNI